MPEKDYDDEDVESFMNGLKIAMLDLSKKHSIECFPAIVAVPITMLHRTLKQYEEHREKDDE